MERDERLERQLFGNGVESGDAQGMGIDFERYNDIPVDVSGENIPPPVSTFADAKFHEVLADNIRLSGYTIPTPIQKHAVAISCSGRDLMGCAQTGSGKTAAFLFPMLQTLLKEPLPEFSGRRVFPVGLILAPTRELATQIYKETCKFTYRTGIRAVVVYGGQSIGMQFRELERGCDVIVATPGRLVDMLERDRVCLSSIKFLIFDEADRMLDMGFEPQIRQILDNYDMNHETRQTSMFSATFPKEIQRLASDFLKDYIFLAVGRVGSATENITQKVVYATEHQKNEALMNILPDCEGLTLIFVETKRAADQLEYWLSDRGINATSIHGDRTQDERETALYKFRKGHCPVLVATSVAARGLDIPNVLMVINYDLPSNIDDYVHRIGRTGRAGHRGTAIAFVNEHCRILSEVYDNMLESKQTVEPWFQKMVQASHSWGGRGRNKGRRSGHGGGFGGRDFRRDDRGGNFNQHSYGGGRSYGGGGGYNGGRYGGGRSDGWGSRGGNDGGGGGGWG
jgi:ATP-dependent RNA helicase DDX3X